MTKEEVRAIAIDKLELYNKKNFLDIGAGSGSISVQALFLNKNLKVTAIEINQEAVDIIQKNAEKFSVEKRLEILIKKAPFELNQKFDAIFIGGSKGDFEEIWDWALSMLNPNGKILATAITLESLSKFLKKSGDENINITLVNISRATSIGSLNYFKPENMIYMLEYKKI